MDIECEDFLELVYGNREAWIDLPAKVGVYWVPFYTEWPNDQAVTRRIDSCLRDREDLYYSVAMFADRGRDMESVLPTSWLWADLDEVHPTRGADIGFLPTVAIQSSPGRYQALWRLSRPLVPKALEKLNRGLSYALDADKGGWDLTQVLRIPGTRNYKYPTAPLVELMWLNEEVYDPKEIWTSVRKLVPSDELRGVVSKIPRRAIPVRAKRLLRATPAQVVEGERSARIWELECLLAESGLSSEEIFDLVWPCAWNKWQGSGTGGRNRLARDIRKAMRQVAQKRDERDGDERALDRGRGDSADTEAGGDVADALDSSGQGDGWQGDSETTEDLPTDASSGDLAGDRLPFVGYSSFMAMVMEDPKWLIEDIWTAGSQGIIGGEPKTNKTTIALALALSVASGADFLGVHRVGVSGPVLMVQEENAPWMMQDRLRKLASYYGLIGSSESHVRVAEPGGLGKFSVDLDFPADMPLRMLNNFGFDLALEEHRDMLEAEVSNFRPVLVILDPLYLIFSGADENSSASLKPFLKWLLRLRYEYNTAIMVVHHMKKQQLGAGPVRPGQRLSGHHILHGWVDSALYLEAREIERDGWVAATIEREFRSMAPQRRLELALSMSPPGGLGMEVELAAPSAEVKIRELVMIEPGITVNKISELMQMDKRTVLARIRGAEDGTYVIEDGKKGRGHTHRVFLADAAGVNGKA